MRSCAWDVFWGILNGVFPCPWAPYSGHRLVLGRAALPLPRSVELALRLRHPPRTGPRAWRRGAGVVGLRGVPDNSIHSLKVFGCPAAIKVNIGS
jgi:hypothetical protein